jgi:hypothetical protein
MSGALPRTIQNYIDVSNTHDVQSILACFADSVEPDARNAPDLGPRPRLRIARSEIAIHEFGRHRHHDHSKNPAYHTTGSKLARRWVVLTFNSTPSLLDNANR